MKLFAWMLFVWIVIQTFYFGRFGPDLLFVKALGPHHVFFILVVLSFLAAKASGKTVVRKNAWPERVLVILTILATVSYVLWGPDMGSGVGKNKWLVCLLNLTFYPYTAYFCVRAFPYDRTFVMGFLKLLCYFGTYLALTGVCEHYPSLNNWVWPDYIMDPHLGTQFGRARGPFMESVAMGRMLAVAFAAWMVMRLEGGAVIRKFAMICLPLMMAGEYFTETRGPWLGFGLVCLAFVVFKTPAAKTILWLGVCVFLAAALGLSNKFSFGEHNLFLEREGTVSYRVVTWITSARMIEAHPLFGIGFGGFNSQFANYYKEGGIEFEGFSGGHNTFLTMGAELGIPGLLLFLSIGYLMARRCLRVYRGLDPALTFERTFVVMTMGCLWMYYFTSWFSDVKWTTVQNTVMFVMLGVVAAMEQDIHQINPDESGMRLEGSHSQDALRSAYDQENAKDNSQVDLPA